MSKVMIDNEEFNTIKEAAEFLELPGWKLTEILLDKKEVNINGFNVKKLSRDRIFTKLMCIETQEVFNTLTDLSKYLKVNASDISNAIAENDCYIDKNGNRYYRLSEKSEIRKHMPKGLIRGKCPEVIVKDIEEADDDEKFLKVDNLKEGDKTLEEQLDELVDVTPKQTAEIIIRNLVIQYINKNDYNTANTLLKVLVNHADKLRN